ncbi:MAG: hypothetical protein HGA76_07060, partial [Candidatus Firestonebacteria bacterium]|nr:hypothetical protein [Candidatus Firestonebacteria bacterium]
QAFREAWGCLKHGGAFRERNLLEQTLEKQIGRELARMEHETAVLEIDGYKPSASSRKALATLTQGSGLTLASSKLDAETRQVLMAKGAGQALNPWMEQEQVHQVLVRQGWSALRQRQALAREQYAWQQAANGLEQARNAGDRARAASAQLTEITRQLEELENQADLEQQAKQITAQNISSEGAGTSKSRGEGDGRLRVLLDQSTMRREQVQRLLEQLQSWADIFREFDGYAWVGRIEALKLPSGLSQSINREKFWIYARRQKEQSEFLKRQIAKVCGYHQSLNQKQARADEVVAGLLEVREQAQFRQWRCDLRNLAAQTRLAQMQVRRIRQMEDNARRRENLETAMQNYAQAVANLQIQTAQSPALSRALAVAQKVAKQAAAAWPQSVQTALTQARKEYAAYCVELNVRTLHLSQCLSGAPAYIKNKLNPKLVEDDLLPLTHAPVSLEDLQKIERNLNVVSESLSLPGSSESTDRTEKKLSSKELFSFTASEVNLRTSEAKISMSGFAPQAGNKGKAIEQSAFLAEAQDRLAFLEQQSKAARVREQMDKGDVAQALEDYRRASVADALARGEVQVQQAYDDLGGTRKRSLESAQFGNRLRDLSEQRQKIQLAVGLVSGEASARVRVREMLMEGGVAYAAKRLESLWEARAPGLSKAYAKEIAPVLKDAVSGSNRLSDLLARRVSARVNTVVQASLTRQVKDAIGWLRQMSTEVEQKKENSQTWWDMHAAGVVRAASQGRETGDQGAECIRQTQARQQRHKIQAQAEQACDQAQGLLDRQVSVLQARISKFPSADVGFAEHTTNYLREQARTSAFAFVRSQLQALEQVQSGFTQDLIRQIAEIKSADAAAVFQAVTQKYSKIDMSQLTQFSLSLPGRASLPDWSSLAADNEVLQNLRHDAFAQVIASNPALQEMQHLRDLKGEFKHVVAAGGVEAQKWFEQTQLGKHLERINGLRAEAKRWLVAGLDEGAVQLTAKLAEGELGSLMKRWGIESQYLEAAMGLASDGLKAYFKHSDLLAQIERYTNVKTMLEDQFETLVTNVQAYVSANAVVNSLDSLSKDITGLMDQLTGNQPLDLNTWLSQTTAHLGAFKDYGAKFMMQMDVIFARLSSSHDAVPLFQKLQEQFTQVVENLGQGLQMFVTASLQVENFSDNILNFGNNVLTGANNFLHGINFNPAIGWEKLTDIINSSNWKFDFVENAAGWMTNINDPIQGTITWVGDRWTELQKTFAALGGGPELWGKELEKVDWKGVSNVCDRFIPPKYRAAKSALDEVVFEKDYIGAAESLSTYLGKDTHQYVHTAAGLYRLYDAYSKSQKTEDFSYASAILLALDLASDYLDTEAKTKYREYRVYADDGVKIYGIGKNVLKATKSGNSFDWAGAIQSMAQMVPALQRVSGPVYNIGQGNAGNPGGTDELFRQIQIDQANAANVAQAYLDKARVLSASKSVAREDLVNYFGRYPHAGTQTYSTRQTLRPAFNAKCAQEISDSGPHDSRVITGQISAKQAEDQLSARRAEQNSGNDLFQGKGSPGGNGGPENPRGLSDENRKVLNSKENPQIAGTKNRKTFKPDYIGTAIHGVTKSMIMTALLPEKQTAKELGENGAKSLKIARATIKDKSKVSSEYLLNHINQAGRKFKAVVGKAGKKILNTNRMILDQTIEFSGYGPDKYYDSITTTVKTSQGSVG